MSGKLWATLPLKEQRGFVGEGGPGLLTRIPVKALGRGESVSPVKLQEAEQQLWGLLSAVSLSQIHLSQEIKNFLQ